MKQFQTVMVRDITPEMCETLNEIMSEHNVKTAQKAIELLLNKYPTLKILYGKSQLKLNNLQIEYEQYQHDTAKEIARLNHIINHVKESINLLNNVSQ
jgi:uncharacterized iron-regulated protein